MERLYKGCKSRIFNFHQMSIGLGIFKRMQNLELRFATGILPPKGKLKCSINFAQLINIR